MRRSIRLLLLRLELVATVTCLALTACMGRASEIPAYPLYPNPEHRLDASKVAKLVALTTAPTSTPILKSVDGKKLPDQDSQAFDLLPGCHVVQTTNDMVMANESMSWSGHIGSRIFPLKMKAGYTYVVRLSLIEGMSGTASVSIRTEEQDGAGATTATFEPAKSLDDIKACQAWQGELKLASGTANATCTGGDTGS